MYPNSSVPDLEWQRLSAAIERGDCLAARDHLDAIVSVEHAKRELVERGRYSREARV